MNQNFNNLSRSYFEENKEKGALYIRNPLENSYPIAVQIIEDKSGILYTNQAQFNRVSEVTEGELIKKLPKGKYKCTAMFQFLMQKLKNIKDKPLPKLK